MEPKFQTSFIPKKPVIDASRVTPPTVKNVNIFSVLANILFLVTVLVSGGLFGYRLYLTSKIVEADKKLDEARSAFEPTIIKSLLDASTRFSTVNGLLENHFAVSGLMSLLEELTLRNVSFSELSYSHNAGIISVSMTGTSRSYNALAKQSEILNQNSLLANQVFSDFSLTDTGNISFKYSANINKELVTYKNTIGGQSGTGDISFEEI
jgi:hypothetical protein